MIMRKRICERINVIYTEYDDEGDMQFYIYSIVVKLICIDKYTHMKEARFVIPKHTHINLSIHYGSCARIIWSLTYDMWKYVLLFLVLIQVELNSTMSGTHIWKEKCQRVEQHGRVKNILTYIASNKYNDYSTDPKT